MEEENLIDQIRIDRLKQIYGVKFLAVIANKVMLSLSGLLYKWGYLGELTETDALTGLFNRNFYERWVEIILAQAERVNVPVSFVMIDMDGLKTINDKQGHAAGDKLLRKLAKELSTNARKSDIVIRLGGDEFLQIFWDCDEANAIMAMSKRLSTSEKNGIGFSFGVSEWKKGGSMSQVVAEADKKMYEMKRVRKKKRG